MATATTTRKTRTVKPAHGSARLTLAINGTAYSVKPTAPDAFAAVRAFRLKKADGTVYDVAQTVHGHTCDCPDFTFSREGLDPAGCKHVKALVAVGLLPADFSPSPPLPEPDREWAERQARFRAAVEAAGG